MNGETYAMLTPEFISTLKKTNISKNPEKARERIRSAWHGSDSFRRGEILALCGYDKKSIYRAYKSGGVSIKMVATFAQVLKIDPRYLAGNSDEQREYTDELLKKFVKDLGYKLSKNSTARSMQTKPAQANSQNIQKSLDALIAMVTEKINNDIQRTLEALSEEEQVLLLRSINLQAKFNDANKNKALLIKYLMMS